MRSIGRKTSKIAFAILFVAIFATIGALTDPLVTTLHDELQNREYTAQNYADWFGADPVYGGFGNPTARAYFQGRADAYREARALLVRLDSTGSLGVPIPAR